MGSLIFSNLMFAFNLTSLLGDFDFDLDSVGIVSCAIISKKFVLHYQFKSLESFIFGFIILRKNSSLLV